MTEPTIPLPPHGTYARSVGRPHTDIKGCTCQPCRNAHAAYKKRRDLLNSTGRSLTVDATPVAEHLRTLLASGTGWAQIRTATGVGAATISTLISGKQKRIRRARAEQLLALKPNPAPKTSTGSLGTVRRVQALIADGHRMSDIAAECGINEFLLGDLAAGRLSSVRRETAAKVAAGYDRLAPTPGTLVRSINRGRREGWPTPAEWAGDIDDPAADPSTWRRRQNRRGTAAAELVEDAEFIMATTGVDLNLAADRLGISRNTLEKARERTGRRQREAQVAA